MSLIRFWVNADLQVEYILLEKSEHAPSLRVFLFHLEPLRNSLGRHFPPEAGTY